MENKLRRGLALLMTLIMLISCAPMDALAAIVPVSGGTQTSEGVSLLSIVKPPVATHTYIFMNEFMNGDNKEFARQILKNGQTLNNPGTPAAGSPNKEFTGWRDGDNDAPAFGKAVTVTETKTITYHAQFDDVYFVFFTNPDGEVMVTKKGHQGDTITTADVSYPVGNEESIVGWKDESGSPVSSVTLNGSDVTLTAKVENGHWITYDSQGGTYVAPAFVKGNGTTTAPAAPTRPGYTFHHWSAAVGGAAFTFGQPLDQALTLYAVWTANANTRYTVIHWLENADDDGYSYRESETKTGATGAQTSAAEKSYTGFTAQNIAQQTIAGDGSTIVNVRYKRNVYEVKFYSYSGWYSDSEEYTSLRITAKYGANISDKWPTYNGSNAWSTTDGGSTFQVNIDTMPLNGAKFYGPKTGNGSESAYYYVEVLPGESGTTVNDVIYKLHHTDTSPGTGYSVTQEDKYPITGFTYKEGTANKKPYNNAKFYYTRNSYNIVFINGGATDKTVSKKYEENIESVGYTPTAPVGKKDYTFGGWYDNELCAGTAYDFTGKTMPAQNVTVYAKWNEPAVNGKAHIKVDGTDEGTTLTATYGEALNAEELKTLQNAIMDDHPGYTWRGWRTGKNGTGEPFNVDTKIYSNITLYPYYTKDGTFTIVYDTTVKTDVTAPVDVKKYAEDSFADLMSPDKLVAADGEYFLGWKDDKTGTIYQPRDKYQIRSELANADNEIKLTGVWGARPAGTTLTYKANGGTGEDVVENLANNETVTTKPADTFSRVGYTFKGWDTNPKGEGSIKASDSVQVDNNGENVLYAIWTANTDTKYTVVFYYQNTDGTYTLNHSDERTTTTDTTVSVTEADKAAKENNKYVFEADNKNNVLSGNVAGDGSLVLKLYFKLNTASYTIHHYLNGTTVNVAKDETSTATIGTKLTAQPCSNPYFAGAKVADEGGYVPSQEIEIVADESKNVITVYYTVPLTITAENANKTYDGQPLTQPDFKMEGLVNGDTKENFTLSMTAESTITNAGSTPNVINTDTVKYNGGAIPSYYNVSYNPGTLTVNKASATVTITGVNETAVYDGKQHEAIGYNYSFTGKPNEITISPKPNVLAIASRTDVGTTYMDLTKDSFTVTSANYDVTIKTVIDGYVTITPVTDKVTVTVTENGDIVTYDGNEHSVKGYKSMTADNKLYDVTKSVKATETAAWTAKGTDAGEYPVGVAAGDFENINKNFTNVAFVIVDGVLKINPITENTITITANSASKTYDGTPLTNNGFTFTKDVLVEGDVLTAVVEGSATNVGDEGKNVVKSYKVMRGDVDVTGNYTFGNSIDGKLNINKRTVTLTSETASKAYDGTPLTKPDVAVTGDGFVAGEVTDVKATGSVTFVHEGEVTNAITYTTGEKFNADNYTITKNEGKLSITQRTGEGKTITVTAANGEKVYDGAPLTNNDFTHAGALVEGDTLTAVVEGSQTDVGVGDNVVRSYKVMRGNVDVTTSYTFTDSVKGALTVTLRGVTFTGESKSLPYTGGMQSITGITQSGLVEGHRYEGLTYKAEGQNVGSYDGAFSGDVVIKDAQGNDVTKNYNVTKTPGKLTITNASFTVTFTGESDTKVYNGEEQSIIGITATGLLEGHTYSGLSYEAKGKDVGSYDGVFSGEVKIVDAVGKDVTENYAVTQTPGKLTITAVTDEVVVTITGHKDTVTYDGKEHPVTGYDVSISNELYKKADFTFNGTAEVKATNASDTAYAMGLKDTDFANKNGNFSNVTFVVTDGSLTINKRTVTLTSETASKAYDGTPLTKPDVAVTGDGFVAGEVTDVKATGSVTFVHEGEVTNAITYTTGEKFNADNYTITKNEGKLSITQRTGEGKTITVTAANGEKVYDGAPLTNNDFTHAGALVEGDTLTAVVEGSQTDVGVGDNVVRSYKVMRGNVDVTTSYTFTDSVKGALTVTLRGVTFTGESKSLPYTGGMQSITGITQSGLVEGHRYEGLTYKAEGQNVGSYDGAFSGDVVIKDAQGNDVTKNYNVTKTPGKLTITNASFTVTFTGESAEKVYNGKEQSITGITVVGLKTGHRYEGLTYEAKGTDKGEYKGAFTGTVKILDENNVDVTENYAVTKTPGKLTITSPDIVIVTISGNKDTVEYDGQKHEVNGYVVKSISNALYTDADFGFAEGAAAHAEGTDAGEYPMNLTKDSFVNKNTNFSAVTFVVTDGGLTITKRGAGEENLVKIIAADNNVYYDGQPHGAKLNAAGQIEVNVSYTTEYLAPGHKVQSVVIDGSRTKVGLYKDELVPKSAVIVDKTDKDVTENYEITYVPGTLEIRKNETEIKVTANSHTWEYDGQAHSDGGYTVEYDGQTYKVEAGKTVTLPTGDIVKAKITKTVTNVSDSAPNNNTIDELTIVNAAGEDTKGQYKTIPLIPGTLTITKRGAGEEKVKITAADNTVEYDGQPHGAKLNAANQIEVGTSFTVTNLAEGHSVKTLAIDGSETDAGVYANKLVPGNAVIVDGNGVEVTANYDITYVPGTLTITKRGAGDMKVVLTAADNTVEYDGQPHGAKLNAAGEIEAGVSYTITNLADGHKVKSVVISGTETAVGEYENRLVPSGAKIVDAEGNDVTRNYVVGYKNGKLTITSPDTVIVTIRGNKDTVEYDGQKHEVNGYEVVSISNTLYTEADFGFANGAAAHAEGTDADEYPMNLTTDSFVNRNANFSAVTFVVEDGKLTITKRGLDEKNLVKIIAANNSVYYDGQPHGAKLNAADQIEVGTSYTTEYLAPGHKVQTVAIDGSETMVGVYEGRLVPKTAIIVDKNDNDVTRNYVITYVPGTLEIRKNETEIKVTANSHTWEYDGQPHSDGGYTVNYDGVDYPVAAGEFATLPTGDKVTATVEGTVTNVADSADDNNVVINVTIANEAGTVVNDQYKTITRVNGGLKITRRGDSEDEDRKVRIIAEPNTVEYDGKAHGAKLNAAGEIELGTSYTTARLVDSHYVDETTLDITGSQTNVGEYKNELKPAVKAGNTEIVIRDRNNNDVTANYALTLVPATLTITGDKLIPDKKAEDENIESNYNLGDKIEFTITVKNVSIYAVENVIVTDANAEIQAGDGYTVSADKHTATIAIIAAKSEIRIKALHTVTSEDILAGRVGNEANVTWKDGETTVTKTVDDDTTKLTPPDVKLTVTKTSDWEGKATGAKPELGTKITYTITVKNAGNVPYTNVKFTDLLQNGDATVTGEIPTYGTLAVNEKKSFTVEYIVTEADLLKGSINNKVTAKADEIEYTYYEGETEKTGKATPKGEAEVTDRTDDAKASTISTKTTTSTPANGKGYALGETITYDIVVTNDGNLTVTSIEVVDNLEGAEIKAGSGYDVVNGKAVIAELKPGESLTVKVEYVVTEADILAGKVVNDATVTGKGPGTDPEPDEPGTDDPTDKPKATLEIVKAVEGDPKNGTSYALGEKITYTLTVKVGADNNVTVKDIRVTDTLLTAENVNAKIVEIAGGYTLNATGEIELPDMAPGADDVVITYTYKVQESDLGSGKYGTVHNAARVKGTTPDPDPDNPNPKPVDPKGEDSNDTPTSIRLIITAKDNLGIEYDGKSHGENGYTQEGLAEGHTITSVKISGSQTNVGRYKDELIPSEAKIEDADGKDVTSHYEFTYVPGTLEIIKSQKALNVVANSNSWTYDDAEHSDGGYTVEYDGQTYKVEAGKTVTLPTGDIVKATVEGTVTNVADSTDGNNVVTNVTITNKAGTVVNDQYKTITPVNGKLTITRRPVQVTVNSESFTYDAAEHTVADEHGKEYAIETAAENSGLLLGHTESLNVVYDDGTTKTESRKYVGTYTADSERDENGKAVVTITKEDSGEDVTANYAITVKPGTLEIEKAEIEIELIGPKSERVYNGQEQVVETTEITTDEAYAHGAEEPKTIKIVAKGLKGEDYISKGTVIHIAKGTYVGEHPGDFVWDGPHGDDDKPTVLNKDGNGNAVDVTENYTFKTTPGSLTIKSNQPGEHPTQPDKEIDGHEPGTKYALGDRIYFKITVRNITLDTLELVEVYDPTAVIVPGDGYTVVDEHHAKIENMPASVDGQEPATVIINAYHVVTEDDIKNIVIDSGYKYENVATITVGDKTIDASKGTNDIEDADYTLKIEKQLINRPASGEKFKLGETAKFQITVTNEGNVTQTDIPVAEKLPGAVFTEGDGYTLNADKTVATITKVLNPADKEKQHGDSIILYAQYTITENDLGNTGLKNIVAAPNGNPGEEPIPVDEAKSMAGQKIWNDLDNLYDTRTESVTVNLMRSLGRGGAAELIRTVTVTQNSGWRYSFDHLPAHDMQDNEYFYWVEEEPITGYETVYEMSDDSHCDIVNNLQTYTLTIHYWQHKLGDTKMEQAFPDYVATLYYKQPYDVESPEREGIILDDMSQARISGTMPAHDLVIDVYYHRIAYRLTIHYIYQDGTMAHEDYTWTYWFNSTYNVPSPIIPGFTPSIDIIAGRMPSHGLELTVVYVGDGEIVIPDEDTSLGFKSYLNAGECFE